MVHQQRGNEPMTNTPAIVAAAIARRTVVGLKLTFLIPADEISGAREWSCYPSSEAAKAKWIVDGEKRGWKLI
jgi:hypothetical protein